MLRLGSKKHPRTQNDCARLSSSHYGLPFCAVKVIFANVEFFRAFFKQVGAGQALFEARQKLLHDTLNPRGLAYSLFAAAEVKLNNPVTE